MLTDDMLTPADRFNLTVLHNVEDRVIQNMVPSYGPDEYDYENRMYCPYKVGKLYITKRNLYFIKLCITPLIEPLMFAEDHILQKDSILVFLGVEQFFFIKDNIEDSFSLYMMKFLNGDQCYYELIPTRFNINGFDWTYNSQDHIKTFLKNVNLVEVDPL